ncbi:MAG: GAF domain-containing protein [Anaerolineae bacterium]|nr:GAF domain-containing protein [Anaerolineae bacterium]
MKSLDRRSRSIAQQFRTIYGLGILPILLAVLLLIGTLVYVYRYTARVMDTLTQEMAGQAEESLRKLGEQYIQTVARDVATQVEIYLAAHPDATMQDLQSDPEFVRIAMQPVGETGYACLYEAGTGIMRIHPNPALIDQKMEFLKDQIPSWWAIFEPSLAGVEISGYYDWLEPDGSIRQKYMTMTPVRVPFHGQTLMIAATTYIDEFSRPVVQMQEQAEATRQFYRNQIVRQGIYGAGIIVLFVGLAAVGFFWLNREVSQRVIRPIQDLSDVAAEIERGEIVQRGQLRASLARADEIGVLARAFLEASLRIREAIDTLEQRVTERTADLARRTAQLEAAATVARRAAEIRDVDTLLNETVRLISDRFGFYHAGIFLIDELGEYAVLRAASSEGGQRMLARGHRLAVGKVGIVGTVAGTGQPRIALDVGKDAVFFDNPDLPLTHSEMALPLKVGERVIGVLDVQSDQPAAFTEEDVAVLQTMADQIALAVENARALEQMGRTVQELERVYGEYTREAWQAVRRARRWVGRRYRRLVPEPVEELPEEARRALSEGRPVLQPVYEEGDGRAIGTFLAVPVKLRGQVVGALNMRFTTPEVPPETVRMVEEIADRLALALENARLLEEARRRAERERLASEISQKLTTSVRMERILQIAAEELNQALGGAEIMVQILPELQPVSTLETEERPPAVQ